LIRRDLSETVRVRSIALTTVAGRERELNTVLVVANLGFRPAIGNRGQRILLGGLFKNLQG